MNEPFICKQCGAECGIASGIGEVCTNPECDANDGCGLTKEEAENKRNARGTMGRYWCIFQDGCEIVAELKAEILRLTTEKGE